MDRTDRKILTELTKNGRLSITMLSEKIGLSKTPTQLRVQKLEKDGVIKGYRAMIDPVKLGLDHIAYVEVRLSDTKESALTKFNNAVLEIPEIEEAHMIAAHFDYLLKIRSENMKEFRKILAESISTLPFVSSTSTFVVMQAVKEVDI